VNSLLNQLLNVRHSKVQQTFTRKHDI